MNEIEQMKKRMEELKRQNARLRGVTIPKEITTVIGSWKGHPVISFEGSFRPFSIGLKKASVILEKIEDVKFFVDNNKDRVRDAPDDDPQ